MVREHLTSFQNKLAPSFEGGEVVNHGVFRQTSILQLCRAVRWRRGLYRNTQHTRNRPNQACPWQYNIARGRLCLWVGPSRGFVDLGSVIFGFTSWACYPHGSDFCTMPYAQGNP